ncbi:MAG: CHAP domain-containing protein, partial [Nitrospira sp.]
MLRGLASATFFGLLLVGLLAGCSGGGSSSSGGNPTPSSTTSTIIGPRGGVAATSDGTITIVVPAGALASNTAITIAPSSANTPQGNIGEALDLGPDGTIFSTPVTISVKYDPNLIPQGVTESSLTLAFSSGSTWTDIPTTVDTVNKLLNGQTTHFSTYSTKFTDAINLPYGSPIGSITTDGIQVTVYSNGCLDPSLATAKCLAINQRTYLDTFNTSNAGGYNSGYQWQCVEFVNRYYYQVYGQDIRVGLGHARDYYNLASTKGLVAFPNNGAAPPQIGDIIVSEGSPYGHVAIVLEVSDTYIRVVQQNWFEGPGDVGYRLEKTGNNVKGFSSAYQVRGWLRRPFPPVQG